MLITTSLAILLVAKEMSGTTIAKHVRQVVTPVLAMMLSIAFPDTKHFTGSTKDVPVDLKPVEMGSSWVTQNMTEMMQTTQSMMAVTPIVSLKLDLRVLMAHLSLELYVLKYEEMEEKLTMLETMPTLVTEMAAAQPAL